jgi:hypothetical protein
MSSEGEVGIEVARGGLGDRECSAKRKMNTILKDQYAVESKVEL